METFTQLFGDLLAFVYHCFDRIVIYGYLSGLSWPEQVVHFFPLPHRFMGFIRRSHGRPSRHRRDRRALPRCVHRRPLGSRSMRRRMRCR